MELLISYRIIPQTPLINWSNVEQSWANPSTTTSCPGNSIWLTLSQPEPFLGGSKLKREIKRGIESSRSQG